MKKTLGLILLFAGLLCGKLYANDTIRWTWKVSNDRTCGFSMSGTAGGEFLVDWGDGTTEVITGEDSRYGSYINHEYTKGDYVVKLYPLNPDVYIKYFSNFSDNGMQTLDVNDCQALERLSVGYTLLTSLEVKGCPSLTKMECRYNRQLKSLEVSDCPSLIQLNCSDNNRLVSLSVEGCSSMKDLDCFDNRLRSLHVSGCENLEDLYAARNDLSFSEVANVIDSITKCNVYVKRSFASQSHPKQSVRPSVGFPMPELPVIKGSQARLDIYRNGLKLNEQGYTTDNGELYFEEIGEYKLVVWHDSVLEYKYDDWSYRFTTYGDTTFVIVCNDYVAGNDMVGWTWNKEKSDYESSATVSFAGTEGETFLIDWGDGERMLVDGTGEMVAYKHEYGLDSLQVEWRLYATTPTAHILKLEKYDSRAYANEKLDVSKCPELTYLEWTGVYDYEEGLSVLDVTKNPKLTYLDCEGNRLTSLDVSQNPLLTYLNCEDNQLTSLDVSKNVNLEYLDCGVNQLILLDVTKNKELTYLECRYNRLSLLDVSKNVSLTYLDCEVNRLTSLDVSQNKELMHLNCEGNQLSSLDVSKNVNLEYLDCSGNPLCMLDVSENLNLRTLYCSANRLDSLDVTKNVNLKNLDCSNNPLTTLDVSKNVNLEELECKNNRLDSLDISQNGALRHLDCPENYLTSLDVSRNRELRSLDCADNRLTVLDVSQNEKMYGLYCAGNRLTNVDLSAQERLSSSGEYRMGFNDNFREVVLDETRSYEMSALPGMDVERILSVRGGHLEGTRMIFEADEVEYLYATGYQGENDYGRRYDTVWFRLVSDNHAEPQIPLTAEFFPDELFRAYVTIFDKDGNDSLCGHECAVVKRIDIGGSSETIVYWNRGVKSLEGLQYFKNLEDLDCNANELTSLDVSHNPTLREIYCPHNRLTSLVVSDKPMLKWLDCYNNMLTDLRIDNCSKLEGIACSNNRIETMDISGCPNVEWLSCVNNRLQKLDISRMPELKGLYCMGNRLSDLDVPENTNLQRVSISFNSIPLSKIMALQDVWSNDAMFDDGWLALSPQRIAVTLKVGQMLDLSSELGDEETEVDFSSMATSVYKFENGRLKFKKPGKYEIRLSNAAMLSRMTVWNEYWGFYADLPEMGIVEVFYDITVKSDDGEDPDNPDNPDEPEDPDTPTANETVNSTAAYVYVRNHTLCLSEDLGEMRVFTVMGQCIYRGNGQSAEVPCAGLYIVQAGGRIWKVVVK